MRSPRAEHFRGSAETQELAEASRVLQRDGNPRLSAGWRHSATEDDLATWINSVAYLAEERRKSGSRIIHVSRRVKEPGAGRRKSGGTVPACLFSSRADRVATLPSQRRRWDR